MFEDVLKQCNQYPFSNLLTEKLFNQFRSVAFAILDATEDNHIEMLGDLYEQIYKHPLSIEADGVCDISLNIHQKDKRRLAGQFYTPPRIVDYCFEQALDGNKESLINNLKSRKDLHHNNVSSESLLFGKILDPSCGTGNFLLGAMRLVQSPEILAETRINFAANYLYGLELDGRAASLARVALVIALTKDWCTIFEQKGAQETASLITNTLKKSAPPHTDFRLVPNKSSRSGSLFYRSNMGDSAKPVFASNYESTLFKFRRPKSA